MASNICYILDIFNIMSLLLQLLVPSCYFIETSAVRVVMGSKPAPMMVAEGQRIYGSLGDNH
jgi:hypothetical protein